jgi:hypothetical protein
MKTHDEKYSHFLGDSIEMRRLRPDTYAALSKLCVERDWVELQPFMQAEVVSWLGYLLEQVADDEDVFPAGKWATIQRLQDMLRETAAREVALHG